MPKLLKNIRITKSSFVNAIRCPKYLYLGTHHPELATPITPEQQAVFDEGNAVGQLAKELYPKGIEIPYGPNAVKETKKAIESGALNIYEATFFEKGVYVRVDILHRDTLKSPWDLIEVKSSTENKPSYKYDIGIQTWTFLQTGHAYGQSFLLHLNPDYRFNDNTDLFIKTDVTQLVAKFQKEIPELLSTYQNVLGLKRPPKTPLGSKCKYPWPCPFYKHCHKHIPEKSVLKLYNERNRYDFLNKGIVSLEDKRLKGDFNHIAQRQLRVERSKSKKPEIDISGIKKVIRSWVFPLFYFDFETISPALPLFKGTAPYQQIPVQFSCHKQTRQFQEPLNYAFLHEANSDPREHLIKKMIEVLGTEGTILCAFQKFEKDRITELMRDFPRYKRQLGQIHKRIRDPQEVFRDHVFFSDFNGSFSIKALAPAILGKEFDYSRLDIASGSSVQLNYLEMLSPQTTASRKKQIKQNLIEYCERDTLVLVKLVDWLYKTAITVKK